ncbi:MAG TPA: carboxymuconolactone decarboxylase family protein [Rhizomicrobium sp.]|jgi:AhpD family alkylhydroperoxidase|nr:carboxymuconolactone decarboxylase family protein [Rhizomicrobium sp.]
MMMDWKDYKTQVAGAIKEISAANPDIVKAYAAFHHANSASKHLDKKTRELIALGVAVSLRCDGCINAHTEAAIHAGATKEEIVDTLGVAVMVNAGAAMVYSARTIDAFNAYSPKQETTP